MSPLNLILSAENNLISKAPQLVACACAIILLAAFFYGFAKGFKQVGWEWMTCLAAFVGFVFCDKLLKEKGLALKMPEIPGMSKSALTTLIIAFTCLAIMLLVYGLFCAAFRPRRVWRKKSKRLFKKEQQSGSGDGNPEHLVWKNCAPPKFYGRFWGSIVCLVNTAVILALVVSALLFFVSATAISETAWGSVLNVKITDLALKYAKLYAMDFITICIPFFVACYGYRRGLVGSLRTIIMKVGSVVVLALSFGLPFVAGSIPGEVNFIAKLVSRCTAVIGNVPDMFKGLLGQLLAGVFLLIVFGAAFAFLNYLLGKYHNIIKNGKAIRVIDDVTSCFLYFILGVIISVLMWAALYALDVTGIFNVTEIISEDASIAKEMLGFVKTFMDKVLAPFMRPVQ